MEIDGFWELIRKSRHGAESCEDQSERLAELLVKLSPEEIVDFDRHFQQRMIESYRRDLWAVAYIINGGCSDDGFDYFRGWLIAQGRDYFEAALENPENAARRAEPGEDIECEDILSSATEAYERKTGEEIPLDNLEWPREPAGPDWTEDDLERLYPELCQRFA